MKSIQQHADTCRAALASTTCVTLLVAAEYFAIVSAGPAAIVEPHRSSIIDFEVSQDGRTATYINAQYKPECDPTSARDRLDCINSLTSWPPETLWTLPSRPYNVLPCASRKTLIVSCRDTSVVEVTPSASGGSHDTDAAYRLICPSLDRMAHGLAYDRRNNNVIIRASKIHAVDPDTGDENWIHDASHVCCMALDELNGWLYCGQMSGDILRISASTGKIQSSIFSGSDTIVQLALSPCGRYLATVNIEGELRCIQLEDDLTRWTGQANAWVRPTFSHDGGHLIVAGHDWKFNKLLVADCQSGKFLRVLGEHTSVDGINCMADGTLYSWDSSGCINAWNLESPSRRKIIRSGRDADGLFSLASFRKSD